MGKHKSFQKILESYYIVFDDFMLSEIMFLIAAEEVSNKPLPYLIVMFMLCTSVVIEVMVSPLIKVNLPNREG